MYIFVVHYKQRKGLGPELVNKLDEIALDDLPLETNVYEGVEMVRNEFRERRRNGGLTKREYIITDICLV